MRVLVCGGRRFNDRQYVFETLDRINTDRRHIDTIIQGGASGADRLAADWADERSIPCEQFAANWAQHGRSAGPRRNLKMLQEGRPDLVVAFHGGAGTANMVDSARAAGVRVKDYR